MIGIWKLKLFLIILQEGKWIWQRSGLEFEFTNYTNWGPNEPNNHDHFDRYFDFDLYLSDKSEYYQTLHRREIIGEDCLEFIGNDKGMWNDAHCSYTKRNPICQLKNETGKHNSLYKKSLGSSTFYL